MHTHIHIYTHNQITYPSSGQGPGFCGGLIRMMYGHGVGEKAFGLIDLLKASIFKPNMTVSFCCSSSKCLYMCAFAYMFAFWYVDSLSGNIFNRKVVVSFFCNVAM